MSTMITLGVRRAPRAWAWLAATDHRSFLFGGSRCEPRAIRFALDDQVVVIAGEAIDGALGPDGIGKCGPSYCTARASLDDVLSTAESVRDCPPRLTSDKVSTSCPRRLRVSVTGDGEFSSARKRVAAHSLGVGPCPIARLIEAGIPEKRRRRARVEPIRHRAQLQCPPCLRRFGRHRPSIRGVQRSNDIPHAYEEFGRANYMI